MCSWGICTTLYPGAGFSANLLLAEDGERALDPLLSREEDGECSRLDPCEDLRRLLENRSTLLEIRRQKEAKDAHRSLQSVP